MPELFRFHPLHLLLVATVIQRLAELVRARKNERRLRSEGAVEFGAAHYPAIVVLHTLWIVAMIAEAIWIPRTISPFWIPLLVTWLAAQALRIWTLRTLGDRWTTRVFYLPGEEPVKSGPYRYLRHPNYVVVIVEIAVLPLIFGCLITAVTFSIVNGVVLAIRIRSEERAWKGALAESRGSIRRG